MPKLSRITYVTAHDYWDGILDWSLSNDQALHHITSPLTLISLGLIPIEQGDISPGLYSGGSGGGALCTGVSVSITSQLTSLIEEYCRITMVCACYKFMPETTETESSV